ncbi:cellulose synthase subunit BcsC-related outer membrane protein [Cupriavidus sp. WKF15]|uniref:cellulose biosynthesis protein BcsC n=1 Tax=Cupriavidus sp. WKF15 TaxID=3032282 RepID=UPI0023E12FD5|nr:cellulose biosynthesis protein BcsC [Cupriavidus sp. WKF15]WER47315.1 cellulose synthase subunit BcsC-related outer membrane protein [Cupriavidus sp. WKF15]
MPARIIPIRLSSRRREQCQALMLALLTGFTTSSGAQDDATKALVDQARYWQARSRQDRAAEVWGKLLRLNPGQPDALYGMGIAELQAGRVQSARTYLERLQKAAPGSPLVSELRDQIAKGGSAGVQQQLEQARQLAQSGQAEQAIKRYEQVAGGKAPQGDLALEYYQTLGGTAQGWAPARAGLERLARANPSDARAQLALAQHLTYRDNTRQEGIRRLESLATRPDVGKEATDSWRRALDWLGTRPSDAPLYQAWLATHPDDAAIRAKLGDARPKPANSTAPTDPGRGIVQQGFAALDAGELERAADHFQSALAQRPNDADALGGMGVLRLKQQRFAEAVDYFAQASRHGAGNRYRQASNSATYWQLVQRAAAQRSSGNSTEARHLLEQAQRLDPNEITAQVALADLQADARQYAAAEAAYRRVLTAQAANADAMRGLVNVLVAQNKNTEALALVERMTPVQREQLAPLGRMRADQARIQAQEAMRQGDSAGARRLLEDAMANDPTNPWVRLEVARHYIAMGMKDQARGVMDNLLLSAPGEPDALFASALAAAESNDWQRGLDLLERIPANQRSNDMGKLQRRLWVHAEAGRASELAAADQQPAAIGVLQHAERYAGQDVELTGALALAYADAGNSAHALSLMRAAMRRAGLPDVGMQLQYAAVLLKTQQDMELAGVLRQLANADMTSEQRRGYDDIRIAYIVRQADALTAAGDLVAAYDTLAVALSERGGNPSVRASLARMYAQAGENGKALALYESVLAKDPRNLDLRLAAIGTATAAREYDWAERALQPALQQAPDSVNVLTTAGRLYKAQGKNAKAAEYFRAAVTAEGRLAGTGAQPGSAFDRVPANPFVGLPGQRQASDLPPSGSYTPYQLVPTASATVPAPVRQFAAAAPDQPYIPQPVGTVARSPTNSAMSAGAIATPVSYLPASGGIANGRTAARPALSGRTPAPVPQGYADPQAYAHPDLRTSANAAAPAQRPLGAQAREPWLADADAPALPAGPRTAREELREIEQQRTSTSAGGPMLRGRNGDSGMSQLTELQVVSEAKFAVGDGKLVARVTPVALDAGNVGTDFNNGSRFGAGPLGWAVPGTSQNLFGQNLKSTSAGSQSAFGVAVGVAYDTDRFGVDIGSTPLGFRYTDVNAGARVNLPLTQRTTLGMTASRRPVTDSLLSYAGARDERSGLAWGGVMASGGRAELGWSDGAFGIYGYGGYSVLTGHDVARNSKWEGGGGFYMKLIDSDTQRFTSGINFTSMGYSENLRYFTFGHGGYFSPQTYFSVTVPLALEGRSGRLSYHMRGALGLQAFHENDAPYFPTDANAQAAANAAVALAKANNLTSLNSAVYPGQSKTGIAYNLVGTVEYQAAQQLFVGGLLGIDNARDYRQWYAGMYVRYALQRQTDPIGFPPVPPRSAVAPLPF